MYPHLSIGNPANWHFSYNNSFEHPAFSRCSTLIQSVTLTQNLKECNSALQKKDFKKIVETENLFWANFCRVFSEKKLKNHSPSFDIVVVKGQALIEGDKDKISEVKRTVDYFRNLALEAISTRYEVRRIAFDMFEGVYFTHPSPKAIDLTHYRSLNIKDVLKEFDYISQHLENLYASVGIDYSTSKTNHYVDYGFFKTKDKIEEIKISLKSSHYNVYPIPPAKFPYVDYPGKVYYGHYLSEKFCDFTIISKEGTPLKVHRLILNIYGGPYFQNLLTSPMKESIEQQIELCQPYEVIRTAIDCIYLGVNELTDKLDRKESIPIYEILEFAHYHGLLPLFKQAINILMLTTTTSDGEQIREYSNLYNDKDLKRLADHLKLQELILDVD
ncbi:MAG: BTB/POZ domain-containing protein [Chlamydiota bacterium]